MLYSVLVLDFDNYSKYNAWLIWTYTQVFSQPVRQYQ